MKKIILFISILSSLLVSIQTNAQSRRDGQIILNQPTVTINDMQYINGQSINSSEPIKINIGSNSRILFGVYLDNPNAWQGTLKVYTKKSSNDTPIQRGGTDYISTGTYSFLSSKDITLYASNFNASGGTLYAEFEGTGGVKYASSSYSIQVVTPPDPDITNNNISGNQTINEGDNVSTITGSNPSGGNGSYTYQWEKQTTGTWNPISGANSKNYLPNNVDTTTKFRRIVLSGNAENSISNIVTKTFIQAPPIDNNTFEFDIATGYLIGSNPTGGTGNYTYQWRETCECPGGNYYFQPIPGATDKDYVIPSELLNSPNINLVYFTRVVYSGSRYSAPPERTINDFLNNNSISFNGVDKMIGSTPTGATNDYTYEWYLSNSVIHNYKILNANEKDYTIPQGDINNGNYFGNFYKRIVKSGFETSETNWTTFCVSCRMANLSDKKLTVFPNPVSSKVSFEANFIKDDLIEIELSSITTGKTTTVFKGVLKSSSEIITVDIPSHLPEGIYTYKVISRSEGFKIGRLIIVK